MNNYVKKWMLFEIEMVAFKTIISIFSSILRIESLVTEMADAIRVSLILFVISLIVWLIVGKH